MLKSALTCLAAVVFLGTPRPVHASDLPPALAVEQAPSDLGELHSESSLLIAADEKTKEVYIYDAAAESLTRYLETGDQWGDPIKLTELPSERPTRLRLGGEGFALVEGWGLATYGLDGNREAYRRMLLAYDMVALKSGWAISLINLPSLADIREEFGDDIPRVLTLDDDLDTDRTGLYEDRRARTGGEANGRSLLLTAAGNSIYAIESGAYRVIELGAKLTTAAIFTEPKWGAKESSAEVSAKALDEMTAALADNGQELSGSTVDQAEPAEPTIGDLTYRHVVNAAAWLADLDRLAIVLDRGIAGGDRPALDLLDPMTGKGRRYLLTGLGDEKINQLTVGHRWIWLRSRKGDTPTYRIDRQSLFEGGLPFKVPEIQRAGQADVPGVSRSR